jgi:TetR/AcrR family transcriptional regulator, cholesterol catabolism regulator
MTKLRDKQHLIDAAIDLFTEHGFERTRLEDVAKRLGLLRGSIYYHVENKGELAYLVIDQVVGERIAALDAVLASGLPPTEMLSAAICTHMTITERYAGVDMVDSDRWSAILPRERLAQILARYRLYRGMIENVIDNGKAKGVFRSDMDTTTIALFTLSICFWYRRVYRAHALDHGVSSSTGTAMASSFARLALEGILYQTTASTVPTGAAD